MSSFVAFVRNIERGTAKNGKTYWKVTVQVGANEHTLWCWDFTKIAEVKINGSAEFTVEKNGDFLNVETAVPVIDQNADLTPNPLGDVTEMGGVDSAFPLNDPPTDFPMPGPNPGPGPERNKVHSIIRQTAWKCAAMISTDETPMAAVITLQRAIEKDMLEV